MLKVESKVFDFINESIPLEKETVCIVGVSGGPDSVALFRILYNLKDALGISLYVVHVEHGIRGEDSLRDAEFTANLVEEFDVPYTVKHVDVLGYAKENGMSEEEAARVLRYRAFREVKAELEAKGQKTVIAVAHHKEDSVETLLLQMIRGSGLKGLTGLRPVRDDVIRPLLVLSKSEAIKYLKDIDQDYCIDQTNFDTDISRNRIRHEVLPVLTSLNDKAIDHILHSGRIIFEAEQYLSNQAKEWVASRTTEEGLSLLDISELDNVLRKQVILEYLRTTSTRAKDISAKQIEAVIGLVLGPDGKSINISGKLQAKKEAGFLKILPSGTVRSKKVYIDIPISITEIGEKKDFSAGDFDISIRTFDDYEMLEKPENPCTKWFDYDKINSNLHMRNRAEGDFLRIDDLGHTQKLRRYLINKKVPSEERDGLLLLASDSEIYWIVGHRVCKAFEVSDDTKKVIEISVRRRRNE